MASRLIFIALRLSLGFVFLWAYFDKMFGLGFATPADKAWLDGVSPTAGFLKFATQGPFAAIFQSLAGNQVIDWLFMLGLAGIGLGLILGIMIRLASFGGIILMALIYLSLFPPENNPFLDEHIIFILVLWAIAYNQESTWWSRTNLVSKFPALR